MATSALPGAVAASSSTVRRTLDHLYRTGTARGDDGREFEIRPSGLSEEHGLALRDLAIREKVSSTIETGFAFGLSGLFLCEALLEVGGPAAKHIAIDPFQSKAWGNAGLENFRRARIEPMLEFLNEPSETVLARLHAEGRQFDLAFIDGDHRFDFAFVDFYFMHRLVRPGGLIVVDDVWMPSVSAAARFFETNLGYAPTSFLEPEASRPKRLLRLRRKRPRIAVYRRPETEDSRAWDHFVPFARGFDRCFRIPGFVPTR